MLRQVKGHSNRSNPSVEKYWAKQTPLQWPEKPVWELKEVNLWPKGKTLKGSASKRRTVAAAEPGRLVTVSGLKYSLRGFFSSKILKILQKRKV